MHVTSQGVSYRDGETELSGYFFLDEGSSARRPGILVVHGGAGLDEHAKSRARGFAAQGYVAFACDMYGAGVIEGGRSRIMPLILQLCAQPEKLRQRANAGIEVLRAHPRVDGSRLAAVGYCFGGMTVLELARSGADVAGVVSVHGSLQPAQKVAQTHGGADVFNQSVKYNAPQSPIAAKILVCHGALDLHVPMAQVVAFTEDMREAQADWQLHIYGNALHGFTHETPSSTPGVAYDAQADARSSAHIRAFLVDLFQN